MNLSIAEAQDICTEILHEVDRICYEENIHYFGFFGTMLGAIRHQGPIPWDADVDIYVPESEMEVFVRSMEHKLPSKYWINYRTVKNHPRCFARIGLSGYRTEVLHIDVFRLCGFPSSLSGQNRMMRRGRLLYIAWKAKVVDPDFYYRKRNTMRIKAKILRSMLFFIRTETIIRKFDELCNRYGFENSEYVGFPIGDKRYIYKKSDINETIEAKYADYTIRIPQRYDLLLKQLYGDYMKFPPKEEQDRGLSSVLRVREL